MDDVIGDGEVSSDENQIENGILNIDELSQGDSIFSGVDEKIPSIGGSISKISSRRFRIQKKIETIQIKISKFVAFMWPKIVLVVLFMSRLLAASLLNSLIAITFIIISLTLLTLLSSILVMGIVFFTREDKNEYAENLSSGSEHLLYFLGEVISWIGFIIGSVFRYLGELLDLVISSSTSWFGQLIQENSSNVVCQGLFVAIILILLVKKQMISGWNSVSGSPKIVWEFMIRVTIWAFQPIGIYSENSEEEE